MTQGDPVDLVAALKAAAPQAAPAVWAPALRDAFDRFGITTPRRIAAALGQFAVEAGPGFAELSENLNYTHPERLCAIFGGHFASPDAAAPFCRSPERLANRVYAGRLGNGDEASGDGWRFRGRGLIQITGRAEYTDLAKAFGRTPEQAAAWLETPAGAALSGCWYLAQHGCLAHADAWRIDAITLAVNGKAMVGSAARRAASETTLKALGATPTPS